MMKLNQAMMDKFGIKKCKYLYRMAVTRTAVFLKTDDT